MKCINIHVWKRSKNNYTSSGKCNDQQKYKAIIEAEMVSTPEIIKKDNTMSPGPSVTFRNPVQENQSICLLTFWMSKNNTVVLRVGDDKYKRKQIKSGSVMSKYPKN